MLIAVKQLNNRGFTLGEMLLSFSVFCLLAVFIPVFFQIFLQQEHTSEQIQNMEWELFLSQLKKEAGGCDFAEADNSNRLVLTLNNEKISFQKYGNQLRRQVNFTGNEIVLQDLQSIHFQVAGQKIFIEAVDTHENIHKAAVYLFIGRETHGQ